jgi:hypothetical protein
MGAWHGPPVAAAARGGTDPSERDSGSVRSPLTRRGRTGRCLLDRPAAQEQSGMQQRRDRMGWGGVEKGAREACAGPARTSGGARAAPRRRFDRESAADASRAARSPGKYVGPRNEGRKAAGRGRTGGMAEGDADGGRRLLVVDT